jgi:hypothetical protein
MKNLLFPWGIVLYGVRPEAGCLRAWKGLQIKYIRRRGEDCLFTMKKALWIGGKRRFYEFKSLSPLLNWPV